MCNSAVERQPGVIAVVDAVVRITGVRCSGADPDVPAERLSSVGAEGTPDLGIGIGDAVSVTGPSGAQIVAGVIPDDRNISGSWIERDLREKLTIPGVIVVHPYACAPSRPAIVGIADVNVSIVAFVLLLQRVHQVYAAIVRAAGTVPCQARLGVNRAVRLGRYEVEASNVSVDHEDTVITESVWTQTVGIDIHIDPTSTLAALRQSAGLHYLAVWTDGNVAVGAIIRAGVDFRRDEAAHLA